MEDDAPKEVKCAESAFYPLFHPKHLSSHTLIKDSLNYLTEITGLMPDINNIIGGYARDRFNIPIGEWNEQNGEPQLVVSGDGNFLCCSQERRWQRMQLSIVTCIHLQTGKKKIWEFPSRALICEDPANSNCIIILCYMPEVGDSFLYLLNLFTGEFKKIGTIYYSIIPVRQIIADLTTIYIIYPQKIYDYDRNANECNYFAGGPGLPTIDGKRDSVSFGELSSFGYLENRLFFNDFSSFGGYLENRLFFNDFNTKFNMRLIRYIDFKTDSIETLPYIHGYIRTTCGSCSLLVSCRTEKKCVIVNVHTKKTIDLGNSLCDDCSIVYDHRRNVFYYISNEVLYAMTDVIPPECET